MSSTNKTTYYNLNQYIGTDKPTYLGDYNSDMSKIDDAIHSAEDKATTASQSAGSAVARVSEVEKTMQTHTQAITTLQSQMTQASQTGTSAYSLADSANTKAENAQNSANEAKLAISNTNTALAAIKFHPDWDNKVEVPVLQDYTCPSDGLIWLFGGAPADNWNMYIQNKNFSVQRPIVGVSGVISDQNSAIYAPCNKGDVVRLYTNHLATTQGYFIPYK